MAQKQTIKLTNARIKQITPPDTGRVTYHDSELRALKLFVWSTGAKAFYLRTTLNDKTISRKLGRFPETLTEKARKKAGKYLDAISDGVDPKESKKAREVKNTTIRQCLADYISARTRLKESTAHSYKRLLNNHIPDWLDKPLIEINRDKIERRHKRIGQKLPYAANRTMRVLRALFEYAHHQYEDEKGEPIIPYNPVKRLNHSRAWFKEARRVTYIKPANIRPWFEVVSTIPDWMTCYNPELIRDFLLLLLFTGLRKDEAAGLRWEWIDLDHRTLNIPITKNGHPHSLPLSDFIYDLLKARYTANESAKRGQKDTSSLFVFPGTGKTGHLVEPKNSINKVRDRCKCLVLSTPYSNIKDTHFIIHDLRRTFITTAEGLGIRDYVLKRLLNHRSGGDVTDGYIVHDVERLRAPMQQITDQILKLSKQQDNVLPFAIKQKRNT